MFFYKVGESVPQNAEQLIAYSVVLKRSPLMVYFWACGPVGSGYVNPRSGRREVAEVGESVNGGLCQNSGSGALEFWPFGSLNTASHQGRVKVAAVLTETGEGTEAVVAFYHTLAKFKIWQAAKQAKEEAIEGGHPFV